jgi:hypothetical protein
VYLQERLQQQREEARTNPDYNKTFKGQLSKEEKKAKRKQILASIGDLPCLTNPHISARAPLFALCTCSWHPI